MNRRDSIFALLSLGVVGMPAQAQSSQHRIAWFGAGRDNTLAWPPYLDAFRRGLRQSGWIEGKNLAISLFLVDGTPEEADPVVQKMLATKPDLIVTNGREVDLVYRNRPTIPVVFAFSGNPIDAKFVQSFSHPGGNFTGVSFMSIDLVGKRIQLLQELVPQIRRLGILARPEHAGEHRERAATEEAARKLGLEFIYAPIQANTGLDAALGEISKQHCDALIVFPDAFMLSNSGRIARFAAQAKISTVSAWATFADQGILLSYGPVLEDGFQRLAYYADRILRGAKATELPVELPRTVELVLNARTARSLGIAVSPSFKIRADRVIE